MAQFKPYPQVSKKIKNPPENQKQTKSEPRTSWLHAASVLPGFFLEASTARQTEVVAFAAAESPFAGQVLALVSVACGWRLRAVCWRRLRACGFPHGVWPASGTGLGRETRTQYPKGGL